MTKQSTENTDTFLHHLDAMTSRSAHHEQLQVQLFHFILDSANKVVTTHCANQQENLGDLSRVSNLNQFDRSDIAQCDADYAIASQYPAKTVDEIDIAFNGARVVNRRVTELVSGLDAELANENAAAVIEATNKEFENKYKAVATNTLLIIGGLLLCGLTFGLGVAEGVGLIAEGVDGLHDVAGSRVTQHKEPVVPLLPENSLLKEFERINNRNGELFNESWLHLVERHCYAQQQSIHAMKSALSPDHPRQNSLQALKDIYTEKITRVREIENEEDSNKKFKNIELLAGEIQKADKEAKKYIPEIKADLPEPVKPAVDGFLNRAHHFYHENQKIINFAALMAVTAAGIALTIATGGIAAAMGAAMLGAVAFKPIKSAERHATHFLLECFSEKKVEKPSPEEEKKLIVALKDHAVTHCEKQINLLNKLEVPAISSCLQYDLYKDQLNKEKTIDGIKSISLQIENLDKMTVGKIKDTKIKKQFNQNAKDFKKENKEMFSAAAKVVLAAAALTVLGIATGGVGVGIALGCAAASWLVGKVIKKVRDYKSTASKGSEDTSEKPPVIH